MSLNDVWRAATPFLRIHKKRRTKESMRALGRSDFAKVEVGLSAQRIYQDLVEEKGFSDSYESVKRFRTQATSQSSGASLAHGMPARRRTAA